MLGNAASTEEESFAAGLLEHPQYTQPRSWQGRDIPEVLLSGNHGEIAKWRRAQAEQLTKTAAPICGPRTLTARTAEHGIGLIPRPAAPIRPPYPREATPAGFRFAVASPRFPNGPDDKQRSDDL